MLAIAVILAVFVVVASFVLAFVTDDPHWCQRGGALIAAIAAFSAVFEASVEHEFRRHSASKVGRVSSLAGVDGSSPATMIDRIRSARFRSRSSALSYDKLKAVFWISSIAVLGELFHGFGDLLYELCASIARSVAG
jgi:hypothetical protein